MTGWWGYRLAREPGGTFVATRGLFTTRSFTADRARMRGITLTASPLVRLFGGALARPVMTGISLRQTMNESAAMLPTTTRAEAVRLGDTLLGAPLLRRARGRHRPAGPAPARRPSARRGPLAGRRRRRRRGPRARCRALGLAHVAARRARRAAAPCASLAGRAAYRALGHALVGDHLYLRRGVVIRRTDVLEVRGISGATVTQSPVQRWLGLAHLVATTAAGEQAYRAVDVAVGDATALAADPDRGARASRSFTGA